MPASEIHDYFALPLAAHAHGSMAGMHNVGRQSSRRDGQAYVVLP